MRHRLLSACIFFATACAACAQQDSRPSQEDIQKLFDVMHIHQQMRMVMESMASRQSSLMHDTLKQRDSQITNERLARYDQIMQEMMKSMPMDAMLEDLVPIYQKHFTKTDIDAMSAFYASATGQKMMNEMPAITSESMQASYKHMQKQMDTMMQRIEQIVRDDEEKQKSAPEKAPSQPKN